MSSPSSAASVSTWVRPGASEGVVGDVCAPDISQRLGDLAAGGASGQGFLHGQEKIVGATGCAAQRVQTARYRVVVTLLAQYGEALALVGLDLWVSAQQLDRLLLVEGELVQADHGALFVVDLQLDAVSRALDLGLLEALLDGGHGAALVLNLLHELAHCSFDVIGHGLHDVGPGERVNGLAYVRLVGDDLLGAQRKARPRTARRGPGGGPAGGGP